ncbi:MDR family MFS transporter [Xylocopilactobacillus apicola]|uniref:Multidrug resistance protein n=1 Tax=Xylocopilactobacillus apicola TaxID=2932184 RepID=A0AAU9D8K5_9LACO|nr:MDR family MFS transporter [Xylocopilactobacillus apicola]BDR58721.1 multidrug resistance protein [Xylocopilactobacillus apicola]
MKMKKSKRNLIMAIVLGGAFIALLAETFLNNALVTIMDAFQVSQATAQWLSTGYLLIVGVMIPLSAWIFNRFQTRKSYLTMLVIFVIGSIICIFANNFYVLLAGRMIEAISAGAMMPFIQNVILQLFKPEERGLALGITGLVVAFGPAVGPTISGFILKYFEWQMLFIVLAVTSSLVLICALIKFPNLNEPKEIKLDWISLIESVLGFGIMLFIFSEVGNDGKITLIDGVLFIASILILVLFGKRQLQLEEPLLNIRVFLNSQFNWTTLLSTLSNVAMVGIELVLPLYLQTTRNESALLAGIIMMPGAIIMGVFNPISGSLYDKLGIKKISLLGFSILLIGTIPMIFFNSQTSTILITISYAVRMIGIALTMMITFTAGINSLEPEDTTYGNAAASTVRQIGGSLGTAISMTVVAVGTKIATSQGTSAKIASEVGYHWAFDVMIFVAVVGILASFKLKSER